jgi:hypothetical protein
MNTSLWLTPLLCGLLVSSGGLPSLAQDAPAGRDARLQRALRQYPEADTNKDGVLSEAEARAFLEKMGGKRPARAAARPTAPAPDAPADAAKAQPSAGPAPTFADVAYGPHARNKLDFWKARSDAPAPVVVFIHGGGFKAGDKSKVRGDRILQQCLDAGVSFAAINYRYRTDTPIQDVLRDCARAIQFIRSKAGEWNVDKARIASYGGSAGAGASLWLAFHDDLADPGSADPVLRESSRLSCAGATACQFSYDIFKWAELFGGAAAKYQEPDAVWPSFYGLKTEEELRGPVGAKWRADCDMHGLISKDDPPVFLSTSQPGGEVQNRGHLLHHPKHAEAIWKRCRETGLPALANLPGLGIKPGPDDPQDLRAFLFKHLRVGAAAAQ